MNIANLKEEAREGYIKLFPLDDFSMFTPQGILVGGFLDTLIDKVVDAVEASVVPELKPVVVSENLGAWMLAQEWNICCTEVTRAFRNFRDV